MLIREGKIPDLPRAYSARLGQVVKAMLRQNVRSLRDCAILECGLTSVVPHPQPKQRPNTAQLKGLDEVRVQIRAGELRKWYVARTPSPGTSS